MAGTPFEKIGLLYTKKSDLSRFFFAYLQIDKLFLQTCGMIMNKQGF